ncbi:hypothetical protein [Reyranella sp.]|uniref:hypothetical protein n=1 Tax=Reyranella sp. TaxID=1929291 RepID=UPI00272F494C|nr:hypothetical protein [Reyranella sp.]MDP2377799.1 hypothetical protein [Reyranella sp.]
MIDDDSVAAIIGMIAGGSTIVLAVAQLTCEHADSPWSPRVTSVLLGMIAGWTAIDCWDVWAGVDNTLDGKAVAFCVVLAASWACRRAYGYRSVLTRPPRRTP